ncbi:MAG: hypothetical protein KAJ14_08585, partial [Candidatus Omnitrophica bacterium]|nr:hypothetical protein [Candidatus Omnitrophota bacterium]
IAKPGTRKVYHDCHIYVDYNYYSVPFEYCGKEVEFELSKKLLRLYYNGNALATHQRLEGKGNFNTVISHYPKYKIYSETDYQEKYQIKMAEIGSYAEQLFFAMKENNNYWLRASQGILSLTKKYSKNVVNLACQRALA